MTCRKAIGSDGGGGSGWRWCGNVWSVIELMLMYKSDLICASTPRVFVFGLTVWLWRWDLIKRQQSNVWGCMRTMEEKLAFDDDAKSRTNWIGKLVIVSAVKYVLNWADQLNFNRSVIIKCFGRGLIIVWPSTGIDMEEQQWKWATEVQWIAKNQLWFYRIMKRNMNHKSGALSASCPY